MGYVPGHVDIHAPGQLEPKEVAIILHGILGSGANWRGFIRGLVKKHPDWRFVVVDLRNHGESVGATPPHTIAACAEDVASLVADRGLEPSLIWGHSFGGKVALAYAKDHGRDLDEVWLLDTPIGAERADAPDPGHAEVARVIEALRAVPMPLANRAALLPALTARGLSATVADWLGTNLRLEGAGYRWRFDLGAIEAMIADYFATDLWSALTPTVELGPTTQLHVLRGAASDRVSAEEMARLEQLAAAGAPITLHHLEGAGHWVHVDAPGPLSALLDEALTRISRRLH